MSEQIVQEEQTNAGDNNTVNNEEGSFKSTKNKITEYLCLFMKTSSIHGLNHIVAARRHYFEVFLWLTVIGMSMFGTTHLSSYTWGRYQSSPTVISIDRDMYEWNTTFPCVTICPNPIKNIDSKKLDFYLSNSKEENKTKLKNFIIGLANATYKSFEYIPDYPDISADKYLELLLNLSSMFKPSLSIGVANVFLSFTPTVTEMGLCYAVNSKAAVYNSPEYRLANRWDVVTNAPKSLSIHPLDGEVFAQVMNVTTAYDVYLHGPNEIPDVTSKFQQSDIGYYLKLYVTALTVYTAPQAALLSVNQRRCRFPHENNLKHNTIYTYTMCRIECRIRLCLKYCQCIPHFYRNIGDEKTCSVKGLQCLARYKDELYTLKDKNKKRIHCGCYPLCDDVNYTLQSNTLQEWFLGTNFQWGMVTYPRLRFRRDILFGFTDLLVAVGGMAGLFLGCSVLSFIEIVYFITLRFFCYNYKKKSK